LKFLASIRGAATIKRSQRTKPSQARHRHVEADGSVLGGINAAAPRYQREPEQVAERRTKNTKGSAGEHWLEHRQVDIAWLGRALRGASRVRIGQRRHGAGDQAIYSNSPACCGGGDQPANKSLRESVGKRSTGQAPLGADVARQLRHRRLALDREKDFEPQYMEKAGEDGEVGEAEVRRCGRGRDPDGLASTR